MIVRLPLMRRGTTATQITVPELSVKMSRAFPLILLAVDCSQLPEVFDDAGIAAAVCNYEYP